MITARLVLLLIAACLPALEAQVALEDCLVLSQQQKCLVAPCQFVPGTCQKCLPCGCSSFCYTADAAASIQWPPYKCGDKLATNCDFLSSIQPGSTCSGVQCKPELVCKEYFCDGKCQGQCVPRDGTKGGSSGGSDGTGGVVSSPYQCPNGSSAEKCWPTTDNTTCDNVKCAEGELCGTFACGAAGACTALCIKDPYYTKPISTSSCGNGAEPKKCTASPSCTTMMCPANSNCIERDCGDQDGCKAVCEPIKDVLPFNPVDPIDFNYYCWSDGSVASKCDFGGQSVTCDPACPEQAFCAPMTGCGGSTECKPVCVKNPWYQPPPQPSPSDFKCTGTDMTAYWCYDSNDTDSKVCETCGEGSVCSLFQCGPSGECKYMCLADPNYKFNRCGADFKQVAKWCNIPGDWQKCDPRCSVDGTYCAPMQCGDGQCKYQCVLDPWWQKMDPSPSPYNCSDGQNALQCNTGGELDNVKCATCTEGNVCIQAQCGLDGQCQTMCLPDPFYRPYMCEDGVTQGRICDAPFPNQDGIPTGVNKPLLTPRQAAAPRFSKQGAMLLPFPASGQGLNQPLVAAAQAGAIPALMPRKPDMMWDACNGTCSEQGFVCQALNCTGECRYRCVKDPYYVPPPLTCLDGGFIAEPCSAAAGNTNDCSSMQCETDMQCGDYICPSPTGESSVCSTQCVRQGLLYKFVPYFPQQQYSCADGSQGKLCQVQPNANGEIISSCVSQNITCPDFMFCQDVECGGVCGPLCVPPPAPMAGGVNSCPRGLQTADCTGQQGLCDKLGGNCPAGTVCDVTNCGTCKAECRPLLFFAPPKAGGGGSQGSDGKGKTKSTVVCASGKAVSPKTCAGKKNPCMKMKCSKKMKCVVGYCGGCNAECVPKASCPNGNRRRGCKATAANFCTPAKCDGGATCVPDQCNGCNATCVSPCQAGEYPSFETARCEPCLKGYMCKQGAITPEPCNGGTFAAKSGQTKCDPCPLHFYTPKPAKPGTGKGYWKCIVMDGG